MKIIMWNAAASFSFMWVTFVSEKICEWNMNQFLLWTVPVIDEEDETSATVRLAGATL